QREAPRGTEPEGGTGGRAGPRGAAADDERRAGREVLDGRGEADVERGWWGGDPAAGDPPGLLEPGDGHALGRQGCRPGREVTRPDPVPGPVTEHERGRRPACGVDDEAALSLGSGDGLRRGHPRHASASSAGIGSTSAGPLLRTLLTSVETGK